MKKFIKTVAVVATVSTLFATSAYAFGGFTGTLNQATAGTIDIESLVSSRQAYFNSLVAQGLITADVADACIVNYRSMLEFRAANGGVGACGGVGGGLGACGGAGGGFGACGIGVAR